MISSAEISAVYHRYWNNSLRVLGALSTDIRKQGLSYLRDTCGHADIRSVLLDVLAAIPEEGLRPSRIAESLDIKIQYCLELLRELESEGYVRKTADGEDSRARKIMRTSAGNKLIRDCLRFGRQQDELHLARLSSSRFRELQRTFDQLIVELDLYPTRNTRSKHLNNIGCQLYEQMLLVDTFAQEFQKRHMSTRGHTEVNETMAWLIGNLLPSGSTVTALAKAKGMTSQAMGRVASSAEKLGYITPASDAADRRSNRLVLTARGFGYLKDAVDGIDAMEQQLARIVGAQKRDRLFAGLELLGSDTAASSDEAVHTPDNKWLIDGKIQPSTPEPPAFTWEEMAILLACWSAASGAPSMIERTGNGKSHVRQVMVKRGALAHLANSRFDVADLELRLQRSLGRKRANQFKAIAESLCD